MQTGARSSSSWRASSARLRSRGVSVRGGFDMARSSRARRIPDGFQRGAWHDQGVVHPLVEQLRFTRVEWQRGLRGVDEVSALRRIEPMNSIGWMVGHLAWQEQRYFLARAQERVLNPVLDEAYAFQ